MIEFRNVYKNVAPLMQRLSDLEETLEIKLKTLDIKQTELAKVKKEVAEKTDALKIIQANAAVQQEILSELNRKLTAAKNLLDSLDKNRIRWEIERKN
jgi:hypothetical protein